MLLLLLLLPISLLPQATPDPQTATIRGFVNDSTNGEPVIYANVIVKGTKIGASTNTSGYYIITAVPPGKQTIIFSMIGYQPLEVEVVLPDNKITQIDVKLVPTSYTTQTLTIFGEKSVEENATDIGLEKITAQEIKNLPKGVEADILRTLQYSSGVSTTGDVTARYFVRGSDNEQNVVLLNGATIYNPFHALGIFSVVDPEIASALEFYKGGFSAQYGGRLSSVLDIITKDGNKNRFTTTLNGSLLAAKASIEGPIPGGSFMLTGRKSYMTETLNKFMNNKTSPFDFYDYSLKVNYSNPEILENSKFVFHLFGSQDDLKNNNPTKEDYSLRNNVVGLNWYQVWAAPIFSEMTFSFSTFDAAITPNFSTAKERKNKVTDFSSKWNFTYIFDTRDELGVGLQTTIFNSNLNQQNLRGTRTEIESGGVSMNIFFKYKFMRFENFGLDIGGRLNMTTISKNRGGFIEPRISSTYKLTDWLTLKAAFGKYSQEITTLVDENDLLSIFEPWIVVPDYLATQEAYHYIFGVKLTPVNNIVLELEGYYKDIRNLTDFNDMKFTANDPDLIQLNGESYGFEADLLWQSDMLYLKAGYSLGWAYKFRDGVRFAPRYDTRHSLSTIFGFTPGGGWNFYVTWNFSTGKPYTPLGGYIDRFSIDDFWKQWLVLGNYNPKALYGAVNSERFPVYHRMDIGVSKTLVIYFMTCTLDFSIINVYDRRNIFYFDDKTGERVDMLPFLPSVSLKVQI
ncbi:MAG: TonB-dependent receptor [Ignavibacteria bacterium]|nr:TonB-dependent receptor [Ignavibacteria bacterium]MBZ0197072.1 TonB-dependent receptor [Ignavibacteriaceae bacterium]